MKSKMNSMYTNQVWTLVKPLEGIKPITCKWVFKRKTDMDDNVQTYKARRVAKNHRQRQGFDFNETISSVAIWKSIRILLAIVTYHDYKIWKMDVKTIFLNENLYKDVYMIQPKGFKLEKIANKECKI
jgi:hypothetical protein